MEIGFTVKVSCNIHLPDEFELPDGWMKDGRYVPEVYGVWQDKVRTWLEEDLSYAIGEAHYTEYDLQGINLT